MRFVLEMAYDGRQYHGWQVQQNANSVQGELNRALSTLLGTPTESLGCGRTDTGVHATRFFAQFDSETAIGKGFSFRLNNILPNDIAITAVYAVDSDFNVRFDATYRLYHYFLHQKLNPFSNNRSYYRYGSIDFEAMNRAAQLLLNHTDFECFSKVHTDVYTFNCTIMHAQWQNTAPNQWMFSIQANRFLRNMVRAIVGSLLEVGTGRIDIDGFEAIIKSKNRSEAGKSVPAHALYLADIGYDFEKTKWEKIDE